VRKKLEAVQMGLDTLTLNANRKSVRERISSDRLEKERGDERETKVCLFNEVAKTLTGSMARK
jgi:hypothetical protein